MSIDKLILGTAGLGGMPYGRDGVCLTQGQSMDIMVHAAGEGILRYDTAPGYGQAEKWLGEVIPSGAFVCTKTDGNADVAIQSLRYLGVGRTTIIWHNWNAQPLPSWVRGASVYAADDLAPDCQCLQQDWNLLQQRIVKSQTKFRVARSVFLQGLLTTSAFRKPALGAPLDRARSFAAALGVDLTTLALRAALENPAIDGVIIGPMSIQELDLCLKIAKREPLKVDDYLPMLAFDSPATDPRTWSKP